MLIHFMKPIKIKNKSRQRKQIIIHIEYVKLLVFERLAM